MEIKKRKVVTQFQRRRATLVHQDASYNKKQKPRSIATTGLSIQSGDALLSHGESPHYHRHYGILLLSSEWIQVELPHYGRQNILF